MERLEQLGELQLYTSPAYPVTTDSLLFSHFIKVKPGERVCDLGTGCGVIPFFLLSRQRQLFITGVDVQTQALELCRRSVMYNRLEKQFVLLQKDFCDLRDVVAGNAFDTVCINPPYKAQGEGLVNTDTRRRTTRHESCTLAQIIRAAKRILKPMGHFYLCHRVQRLAEVIRLTEQAGLAVKRMRVVFGHPGAQSKLFFIEARKGAAPGLCMEPPLILTCDGQPTPEVAEIYRQYGRNAK